MLYVLGTLIVLGFCIAALVVVGRAYPGGSSDLIDWKPTRSPEVEAQNEIDDVRQMIEAQNEMRRRRGAEELTEAEIRARVSEEERLRLHGRGPFRAV
jgi:hypothetical protein